MKTLKIAFIALFALFAQILTAQTPAAAEKATIAVSAIEPLPALYKKVEATGAANTFQRVLQSMDSDLISALQTTRKFEVVGRSDLAAILKEQDFAQSGNVDAADKNAAIAGKIKGAKYILIVTVTDFQDYVEVARFDTLGKSAEKRIIRFGAVGKVYDSKTGSLIESTNFTVDNMDIAERFSYITKNGNLNDELVAEISRIMAGKIAAKISDMVFPVRVLSKRGTTVTINRGEGSGVQLGQEFEVFALGGALIDPDTGENLGNEEVLIGKIKVTRIMPKFSQADVLSDSGIETGSVARLAAPSTTITKIN